MSRAAWGVWLRAGQESLKQRDLLRVLRPLVPTEGAGSSPVKVLISASTREAWLNASAPSPGAGLGDVLACDNLARGEFLHDLTLFSTNDYLGLSTHPSVKESVRAAVARHGMGPRASSLVAGHTRAQRDLELQLARMKDQEDCVLFPCGFSANTAVAAVLAADDDVDVFSDELNHASIIDGLRLATRNTKKGETDVRKRTFIYQHNNMQELEQLLAKSQAARKLVITDSLFSMDGDFAPIKQLLALREREGFLLVVDDAHATLVCDRSSTLHRSSTGHSLQAATPSSLLRAPRAHDEAGRLAEAAAGVGDLCKRADVVVGTMSKAIGALGGFVCASTPLVSAFINSGRALIYSTALPVPVVAAASAAIHTCRTDPSINAALWHRVALFQELSGVPATSPIVPIVLGHEAAALEASRQLLLRGMHVPAIRPPTVKPGTSRLRVALSAAHSEQDIVDLVAVLHDAKILPRNRA